MLYDLGADERKVFPTRVGMNRQKRVGIRRDTVFPTHVGMNRVAASLPSPVFRVPDTCGDEPPKRLLL